MKRTVLQFAGLWLGVSGALCYAQGNLPTFGNTYRVAYASQDDVPAPPVADDAALPAPVAANAAIGVEPGMPMSAGPIGYQGAAYGYGGPGYAGPGYGGEACCEPTDPCAAGLWDGYWSAKRHWCQKSHGCGHHGLLPQLNWAGGCCAHRACFGAGVGGGDCCGAGHGGHGLFGGQGLGGLGFGGHGHGAGCGCAEEVVEGDCGCEPCGHGCGHRNFLPQLNWAGGCCAHRACFGAGAGVGHGHGGQGFLGHGHHGVGVMDAGCSSCGN
ncbi:MAG TPA: hypothetical protein VGN57_00480 [Pirellulaceae bacterium]|jgi:hypothetical protein|nr:hypothetical protein [Pirellulaceae bacterium]